MTDRLLAVDGGNSKTDLVLFAPDGTLLAASRGPTVSHQQVGLEEAGRQLRRLVEAATLAAGSARPDPLSSLGLLCLAGMDLPSDKRALTRVHGRTGIASSLILESDTVAGLRAGSPAGWGVGVVVGAGINAIGIAPDGRRARFAGLGPIAGDRGGGLDLGMDGLGAAVRAQDGRGPRTRLEALVPAHFGLRRPIDVTVAIYTGRVAEVRAAELAAVVVAAAADGDEVAIGLVDALVDECASFITAAIRRLRMARLPVPVVLSGGVARGAGSTFAQAVADRVRRVAPACTVSTLLAPPVVGAALLALDHAVPGDAAAQARLRGAVTDEKLQAGSGSVGSAGAAATWW